MFWEIYGVIVIRLLEKRTPKMKTLFIFEDFLGDTHAFTKENLKERNKDWKLVAVKNINGYNEQLLLKDEEFESFLKQEVEVKETVFKSGGLYICVSKGKDLMTFVLEDEGGRSIFELKIADALTYENYLIGMKILRRKVELVVNKDHEF